MSVKIYPLIIDTILPSFTENLIRIPYQLSRGNGPEDLIGKNIEIQVKTALDRVVGSIIVPYVPNNSLEIVLSEQAGEISPEAKNFISMAKRNIQRFVYVLCFPGSNNIAGKTQFIHVKKCKGHKSL